jgi:predicted ArsR family transcriptional regulator
VTVDLIAGRLGLSTKAVKEHIGPLEAMGEIERFVIGRVTGYVIPKDKQEGTLL